MDFVERGWTRTPHGCGRLLLQGLPLECFLEYSSFNLLAILLNLAFPLPCLFPPAWSLPSLTETVFRQTDIPFVLSSVKTFAGGSTHWVAEVSWKALKLTRYHNIKIKYNTFRSMVNMESHSHNYLELTPCLAPLRTHERMRKRQTGVGGAPTKTQMKQTFKAFLTAF